MSDKDLFSLESILEAALKIETYAKDFKNADDFFRAQKEFDACLMNFIVIAEMIDRLSADIKNDYTTIDWIKVKGFRNFIAHDYFGIDAEEVWQIISNDLPKFVKAVKKILKWVVRTRFPWLYNGQLSNNKTYKIAPPVNFICHFLLLLLYFLLLSY